MSQKLIDDMVGAVEDYYRDNPNCQKPLLLSRMGLLKGLPRLELTTKYGKLTKAVEAAGPERLLVINPKKRPGTETLSLPHDAERIVQSVMEEDANSGAVDAALERLPPSVIIAFCVKADPSDKIALHTTRPFKYVVFDKNDEPPAGALVVDDAYRVPGLYWKEATRAEKRRIWTNILGWTDAMGIRPEIFTGSSAGAGDADGENNALGRLIAAQDPSFAAKLLIPADIARILMLHK